MNNFESKRIMLAGLQNYLAPPSKVFPLLCPVREYDWIDSWSCNMIYAKTEIAEEDAVFITDHKEDGPRDVWTVSKYLPNKEIEFVRINDWRVIRYNIKLKENDSGKTSSTWTQIITTISEEGNRFYETYDENNYKLKMKRIEKMMNHYLVTGEKLILNENDDLYS